MPLPEGGKTCWPPEHCKPINRQIAEWAAWYSGDVEQLAAIYGGETGSGAGAEFFASEEGGFKRTARRAVKAVRRWFWGNNNPSQQPRNRLHVPIAGDIASASADLLFAEPPTVTATDPATQARLDELLDDGAHATLLEAAEIAAGLGGVYLRVCWDPKTNPDRPWFAAVHPDAAIPEWSFGRLTAVTFWRVLRRGRTVVRHLERHEPGKVLHGVYEGDDDELGRPVPLTDYAETAGLADDRLVDGNEIPTGSAKLAAVYVPNMRPNRVWRNTPHAAPLGRSDYSGVEPMMDALDLTESSWIRDVDLGKARLVVPKEYLQSHGKGQGASVDLDREVYEPINVMGGDEGKGDITQVQFAIRVEEHERTTDSLKASIVGSAGYSAQTFGLQGKGEASAQTATEVVSKDRRSLITRGRKIRYWRPGLLDLLEVYLDIDIEMFGADVVAQRPALEWPDGVAVDPEAEARTLLALDQAGAMSTEEKVRRLHPDWDDPKVDEEVARIHAERGMAVEDPATFTGADPAGQDPPAEGDPPTDPQEYAA